MEDNGDILRALLAESDDNVLDIPIPSEDILPEIAIKAEDTQPEEHHDEIPQEVLDKYMEKFTTIKLKLNSMDNSLGHVYDNPHDAWKIKFLVNNMFEVNSILKDMHSLLVDMNNIFAQ
jgi:hypothetical protein